MLAPGVSTRGAISAHAEEYTCTFVNGDFGTTNKPASSVTKDGVTWSLDFVWQGKSSYISGLQLGSNNAPLKSLTLSTSGIQGTISKVTVNARRASKATGTVSVSVGGTSMDAHTLTTTDADYDFTPTTNNSGEIVVSLNHTGTQGALYINSIKVTYSTAVSTKTTPKLTFANDTLDLALGTDAYNNFTGQTVTVDPAGAPVKYSSDNAELATVDETTGVVFLVKGATGTATITASVEADETYNSASAKYTITVTDPNATEATFDFTKGYTNQQTITDVESAPVKISFSKGTGTTAPAYYSNGTSVRLYKGNTVKVSVSDGYLINTIDFDYGTGGASASATNFTADNGEFNSDLTKWTGNTNNVTFTANPSTSNIRIQTIKVSYAASNLKPTTLAFAKGDTTFYQGDNVPTFTNVATLTPAVEGAKITYSSSDENIAVVDANGEVVVSTDKVGTATITAEFAGNDSYAASKATYTITIEKLYQNIAALKAAYGKDDLTGALKLTDVTVTYADNNNTYIQDESGALDVYKVSAFDYEALDVLNGIAKVTYKEYNGVPEITAFEPVGEITKTSIASIEPTKLTIADANKDENLCKYVAINNVEVTPTSSGNATATSGDDTIGLYKNKETFVAGQYDVIGIVSAYRNNKQIVVISYNPDFTIDEDAETNAITPGEHATVTINRTFSANSWSSFVLPFDMTAEQVAETFGSNAKFANYVGTTKQADGTYTLNFQSTTELTANTPVFVYGATSDLFSVDDVTVVKADPTSAPSGAAFTFVGTYDKATAQANDWFISSDNNLYKAAGTESIKATRAVFRPVADATAGAKSLAFSIDGGQTTGISAISADGTITLDSKAPIYNLAGQRVGKAYKGIVIQNGKKFIK